MSFSDDVEQSGYFRPCYTFTMNETNNQTPEGAPVALSPSLSSTLDVPTQEITIKKTSSALGVTSLILACVAFMAPLLHWIVILALAATPATSETFGAGTLGVLLALVAEWVLLPTVGLASLITGIIAIAKNSGGRKWGLIAMVINGLTLFAVIAQIIYWGGINS
jgi:hypothetical protein